MTSEKKKNDCISYVGRIFCPNSPKLVKTWPPKKKKHLHFKFGCHFCKWKAHTGILRTFSQINFTQISTDFDLILSDFAQIFPKSKVLGCGCTPASYSSGVTYFPRNPYKLLHVWRQTCVFIRYLVDMRWKLWSFKPNKAFRLKLRFL